MKAALMYDLLRHSAHVEAECGKPAFVVVCADNALCMEITDICEKLQKDMLKEDTKTANVATLMANMKPEETSKQLNKKANVFIVTPGKLLDLSSRQQISLSAVERFVFDQIDCLLLYDKKDTEIVEILQKMNTTQHVVAMTCRISEGLKQRWDEVTPVGLIKLANMIILEDTYPMKVAEVMDNMIWHPMPCALANKGKECAAYLTGFVEEDVPILAISNYKTGVDHVATAGRLILRDDYARHRSGLKDPDERFQSLKDFRLGKVKVLVSTRRSIYGASFGFLPRIVLLDTPSSYAEALYIVQW